MRCLPLEILSNSDSDAGDLGFNVMEEIEEDLYFDAEVAEGLACRRGGVAATTGFPRSSPSIRLIAGRCNPTLPPPASQRRLHQPRRVPVQPDQQLAVAGDDCLAPPGGDRPRDLSRGFFRRHAQPGGGRGGVAVAELALVVDAADVADDKAGTDQRDRDALARKLVVNTLGKAAQRELAR